MPKTLTFILALLAAASLGAVGGYQYRKNIEVPAYQPSIVESKDSPRLQDTSNIEKVAILDTTDKVTEDKPTANTEPMEVVKVSEEVQEQKEKAPSSENLVEKPTTEVLTEPTLASDPNIDVENMFNHLPPNNSCFGSEDEISLQLTLLAERMERDSLWYDNKHPKKLQDCSGIFHRISQFVEKKCDGYAYPSPKTARDSRSLAGWFHKNNNLTVIEDPVASRNLIRPGSVMFFGGSGKRFQQMTPEQLFAPYPHGIVAHIGVVTEVAKDENGDVIGYVMMHGRRPGVFAQRSHYHSIDPPRFGYPSLGNWNQQWIGVGYIMSPLIAAN